MPEDTKTPPPIGNPDQAEKYINTLSSLISTNRVEIVRTELQKFSINNMLDHYRIPLKGYIAEVSHTKYPNSDKDMYVLLFSNTELLKHGQAQEAILSYLHITKDQFEKIKHAADQQLERKKKEQEEQRLHQALQPIDQILEELKVPNSQENN